MKMRIIYWWDSESYEVQIGNGTHRTAGKDLSELLSALLEILKIPGKYKYTHLCKIVINLKNRNQFNRYVKVLWDYGKEFTYRIGAENAYDLRVSVLWTIFLFRLYAFFCSSNLHKISLCRFISRITNLFTNLAWP